MGRQGVNEVSSCFVYIMYFQGSGSPHLKNVINGSAEESRCQFYLLYTNFAQLDCDFQRLVYVLPNV